MCDSKTMPNLSCEGAREGDVDGRLDDLIAKDTFVGMWPAPVLEPV